MDKETTEAVRKALSDKRRRITFYADDEMTVELGKAAAERLISRSKLVEKIVTEWLEQHGGK